MPSTPTLSSDLDGAALEKLALRQAPLIRLGDRHPFIFNTTPMSSDWKFRFDERNVNNNAPQREIQARQRLIDGLVAFGGERAHVALKDKDLNAIITRGILIKGRNVRMIKGEPCSCHSNVAELWNCKRDRILMMTGYGLSKDGMWRQHSWALDVQPRSAVIVETTVKRIAYFGFVMTEAESVKFYKLNHA